MTPKQKGFLVNILENLMSEDFKQWYEKDFQDYVDCSDTAKSDEKILLDIINILVSII